MKTKRLRICVTALAVTALAVVTLLAGCGGFSNLSDSGMDAAQINETETADDGRITVGFSQLGSESNWRMASSASMKEALSSENGFSLLFEDGQQKQENQVTAIRKFILQEVDYIVLAPIVESGWDSVLQEAKDAGIPVIIVDRRVNVTDHSLYSTWVGSNFLLEGRKACQWLKKFADIHHIPQSDIKIVDIQGTTDASAQLGRTQGLTESAAANGWKLLASENGDFTQAKGQEVMKAFLNSYPELNVVYCENDDEALGAIQALRAAGKTIGTDIKHGEIMVLSFDATTAGLQEALNGNITLDTECNPLLGSRVKSIIKELEAGREPEKNIYVDEGMFSTDTSMSGVIVDNQEYKVTHLTDKVLNNRKY